MSPAPNLVDFAGSLDCVIQGDNLAVLPALPDASFQLIYIDPPFNTGKAQTRRTLRTERADEGDRVGFAGRSYQTTETARRSYLDIHDDYLAFLAPRLHRPAGCWPPTAPSTSTSTTGKPTTARCCSTRYSAGNAS